MIGRLFISKEYYKRKLFEKNQFKKMVKVILKNDVVIPLGIHYEKNNNNKQSTISIFHARCRFSGRPKANLNKFKMSRMVFKRSSEFGLLNGIRKATW